jgi:hypothetical protein
MCGLCGNPLALHFSTGSSPLSPSPAPSLSTPQGIAAAIGALDKSADITPIAEKVKQCEAEHKSRIEKDLAGLADLELLGGAKGRRFVLAYWYENAAHMTQGIEYPKRASIYTVFILEARYPLRSECSSMEDLCKRLNEHKIPYHIAYFDNK